MKKFFKTVAMMMALVMVIDAPVSAAGLGASNTTVEAATVFEGEDKVATIMADGTHPGNDEGSHPGDDKGTHPGNDEGSHSGEDWGTGDGFDQPNQIVSIAIRGDKTIYLEKLGERSSTKLIADLIVNKPGFKSDVKWTKDGDAVDIKMDEYGFCDVVAVKGGTATVTITVGRGFSAKSDSVTVHVKEYTTNLKFGESEYTFYKKNKINPMDLIERTPATANDEITFSVDNSKIATIDKNGFITMKNNTSTPIILTAVTEKGVVATTKINVEEGNPVTKLEAENNKVTADYSDATLTTLSASVTGVKESGKKTTDTFEWASSKPKIVQVVACDSKVNSSDKVTAKIKVVGVGKANVTVKASSGKKATFIVTATANLKDITITRVDGLEDSIGSASNPILIYPKQKITLLAMKNPSVNTTKVKATIQTKALASASWKKQDNTIVVTAKKVKGIAEGGEPFVLDVECENVKKSVNFKLMPSDAASVEIMSNNISTLKVGEKVRFGATVKNSAGKELSSDVVVWSSSSAKVLSIDADGYATALKAGKAKIKATVYDAKGKAKTAQVQIEVKQPITSMYFKNPTIVLNEKTKKNVSFTLVFGPKGAKAAKDQIDYYAFMYNKDGTIKSNIGLEINKKNQIVVPNSMEAGEYIHVIAADNSSSIATEGRIVIVEKGVKLEADLSKVPTGNGVQGYNKKVLTVAPGTMINLNDAGVMVQKNSKKEVITNLDQNQFPVTYTFSKKGIVSIDQKGNYGRLFALAPGKVKVTAKLAGGAKTTFTIEVKNPNGWSGSQDGSWDGSFDGTGDAGLYEKGFRGIKSLKDSRD